MAPSHTLFPTDQLFLIAGPCQAESDALNLRVAAVLARLVDRVPGGVIFKASFDKANRSNPGATRGLGLDRGLEALATVKRETGLPVLTDVHLPEQCAAAAQVCDVLQIPAFLCRQTDLLEAAAITGKPINIKKGQWLQPEGMRGAVEKVRSSGTATWWWTCGTSRGCVRPHPHQWCTTPRIVCSSRVAEMAARVAGCASVSHHS
jgi:2-dehydro-3-deoxyphosphooctonate aldolase (KDO 8-P synthase)